MSLLDKISFYYIKYSTILYLTWAQFLIIGVRCKQYFTELSENCLELETIASEIRWEVEYLTHLYL